MGTRCRAIQTSRSLAPKYQRLWVPASVATSGENRAAIRKREVNPAKNKLRDSEPESRSCLAGDCFGDSWSPRCTECWSSPSWPPARSTWFACSAICEERAEVAYYIVATCWGERCQSFFVMLACAITFFKRRDSARAATYSRQGRRRGRENLAGAGCCHRGELWFQIQRTCADHTRNFGTSNPDLEGMGWPFRQRPSVLTRT